MPTTLGWNEIALRLALTVVAGSLICASRQHCVRCHDRGDALVCNCNWSLFWRRPIILGLVSLGLGLIVLWGLKLVEQHS